MAKSAELLTAGMLMQQAEEILSLRNRLAEAERLLRNHRQCVEGELYSRCPGCEWRREVHEFLSGATTSRSGSL